MMDHISLHEVIVGMCCNYKIISLLLLTLLPICL